MNIIISILLLVGGSTNAGVLLIRPNPANENSVTWITTKAPAIDSDGTWTFVDFCTGKTITIKQGVVRSVSITTRDEAEVMCNEDR